MEVALLVPEIAFREATDRRPDLFAVGSLQLSKVRQACSGGRKCRKSEAVSGEARFLLVGAVLGGASGVSARKCEDAGAFWYPEADPGRVEPTNGGGPRAFISGG